MPTIYLSIFDAATKLKFSSESEWNSFLSVIPESDERRKIVQMFRPPSPSIKLFQHFNSKSFLFGRHLLRGLIKKVEATTSTSTKSDFSKILKEEGEKIPLTNCSCCNSEMILIPRTFEARPCLSTKKSEVSAATTTTRLTNNINNIYHDNLPNVNLSHNTGFVCVGVLDQESNNKDNDINSTKVPFLIGVDTMCIDTVPSSIGKEIFTKKNFTIEKLEECVSYLEPYLTKREQDWVNKKFNAIDADDSLLQKNKMMRRKDFAKKFFQTFETRRRNIMRDMMTTSEQQQEEKQSDDEERENEQAKFLQNDRLIWNMYRMWRFLILWTAKEAVLKAAGIGLGFDPSSIEVIIIDSTTTGDDDADDVDSEKFYSFVSPTSTTTTTATSRIPPHPAIRISVSVPEESGVVPSGTFGSDFFYTWLFFDPAAMSVCAVVAAPAFFSSWSTQEKYVMKNRMENQDEKEEILSDLIKEYKTKANAMKCWNEHSAVLGLRVVNCAADGDEPFPHLRDNEDADKRTKSCCGCCFARRNLKI